MAYSASVMDHSMPYVLMLNVKSLGLTDEQFLRWCADNEDLRLELTAEGELVIMPATGLKTGWRSSTLNQRLANWAEQDTSGLSFDSSTLFTLPNGAKRSPDAAWVRRERWEALSREQREGIGPLCPDFVVELCSPSDRLSILQDKMMEYMDNGVQLGWLIDPQDRRVYIYRPGEPVEALENPATLSGGPVLPAFVFEVREIWQQKNSVMVYGYEFSPERPIYAEARPGSAQSLEGQQQGSGHRHHGAQKTHNTLEWQVQERTAELAQADEILRRDMAEFHRQQAADPHQLHQW